MQPSQIGDDFAVPSTPEALQSLQPSTNSSEYEKKIQVRMIGAVGDDQYGKRFHTELNKNGIDSSDVITVPNTRSSVCFVMIENSTRQNRCLFTLGATATWKKEHFLKAENLANGIRPNLVVAQMEIDKEVVEQMIETAGDSDIDFCLNAAPANPISERAYRYITHLLVNELEFGVMSGRTPDEVNEDNWLSIAQEFLDRSVKNVAITLGERGAYYANATDHGHCLAYKVKVIDTTGAG